MLEPLARERLKKFVFEAMDSGNLTLTGEVDTIDISQEILDKDSDVETFFEDLALEEVELLVKEWYELRS